MLLVSTTGKIIECFGPYLTDGNNNDAKIVKHLFITDKEKFSQFFKTGDIFVVDRGFRDCVEFLEALGIDVFMPNFLYIGKQHTTQEANNSRIVTKNRWVIEAVNGLIKKWLFFNNVVPNNNLPFIATDFRILCAIINKFKGPRIIENKNSCVVAEKMLEKINMGNDLMKYIQNFPRLSKKNCITDPQQIDFPILTEEYLSDLSFGSYQLKQAKSYVNEHLKNDGNYSFEIFNEHKGLIRTKVNSRHSSKNVYNTWIRFNQNEKTPVKDWYCTCRSGARVVGCCAHVISVLWFLGYHRYNYSSKNGSTKFTELCFDASKVSEEPMLMSDDECLDE